MRWQLAAPLLGALLLFVVVTSLTFLATTTEAPDVGGTYVEGVVGSPPAVNPLLARPGSPAADLAALLYDGLLRVDETGQLGPGLAERWEAGAGGTAYVFQLAAAARWHDDRPVTADDVVATARLIQDPLFPADLPILAPWRSATVVRIDDHTVRITLREPLGSFPGHATIPILPAHLIAGRAITDVVGAALSSHPIGSGPFRFVAGDLEAASLERNPTYHGRKPYLAGVRLVSFPDQAAALAALRAREIDGFGGFLTADAIAGLGPPVWQISRAPATNAAWLVLNLRRPILRDRAVRQALAEAIDRPRLISETVLLPGVPTLDLLPPADRASPPTARAATPTPGAVATAQPGGGPAELLSAAGWLSNADGVRRRGDEQLRLTLTTNEDENRRRVGQAIAQQWMALGARVDVTTTSTTMLFQDVLIPGRFDVALVGVDLGLDPDPLPLWHSSQVTASMNFGGAAFPSVDTLLDRLRRQTEPGERRATLRDLNGIVRQEVPAIPLYHPVFTYLTRADLRGVRLSSLESGTDRLRSAANWHLRTRRVIGRGL